MKTLITGLLLMAAALLQSSESHAQRHYPGRDRYAYHRPYRNSYNHNYYGSYYRPRAPRVSVVGALPFGAVLVRFGNRPYHYCNGTFYRPAPSGYFIAPPPVGIIVPALPGGSVSVMIGGRPAYYYSGTYYLPLAHNGYQVMEAPEGEQNADALANAENDTDDAYQKIVLDGKTYYKKGDTYYKALVSEEGEITYEAVGQTGK